MIAFLAASALFVGCGPTKHQALNPVEIFETSEGFIVKEAGEKVMSYQRRHKSINGKYLRANYIHPLYGLDGQILTEDFPTTRTIAAYSGPGIRYGSVIKNSETPGLHKTFSGMSMMLKF